MRPRKIFSSIICGQMEAKDVWNMNVLQAAVLIMYVSL